MLCPIRLFYIELFRNKIHIQENTHFNSFCIRQFFSFQIEINKMLNMKSILKSVTESREIFKNNLNVILDMNVWKIELSCHVQILGEAVNHFVLMPLRKAWIHSPLQNVVRIVEQTRISSFGVVNLVVGTTLNSEDSRNPLHYLFWEQSWQVRY